jgi:murein DD-endopeptidase MepM/ murein hydrolase activator NlpD
MAAFDTTDVKFFARSDGTARAFVGFPFDRKGGTATLQARVRVEKSTTTRVGTPDVQETEQIISTRIAAQPRHFPTQHISMKGPTAGTMSRTSALRAEKVYVQSKMKDSYPAPLWSGNWIIPARGRDGSPYGRRRYVNGKWWGQHNGSDIKASSGTPVAAANSGRVVLSEHLPTLRGNCVVIDHGCNVFSIYMHLSQRAVRVGDSVRKGQVIGKVGSTGFSTGPHLHWEIRVGWEPVDPYKVVRSGLNF